MIVKEIVKEAVWAGTRTGTGCSTHPGRKELLVTVELSLIKLT
jgi:hypothetical protein